MNKWVLIWEKKMTAENEVCTPNVSLLNDLEFAAWMRGEGRPKTPITFEIYALGEKVVWSKE